MVSKEEDGDGIQAASFSTPKILIARASQVHEESHDCCWVEENVDAV